MICNSIHHSPLLLASSWKEQCMREENNFLDWTSLLLIRPPQNRWASLGREMI